MGATTQWGIVTARTFAGREQISAEIARLTNGKVINMGIVAEECKKRLKDPEAEEFEGDVPIEEVQKDICAIIAADRSSGLNVSYVFDGFHHKKSADFISWAVAEFGSPAFWLPVMCTKETAGNNWKKLPANEGADEVGEEVAEGGAIFETEKADMAKCL